MLRIFVLITLSQTAIQFRVVRLVDALANEQLIKIDLAVAKENLHIPVVGAVDRLAIPEQTEHASALLGTFGAASLKAQSIATGQRTPQIHDDRTMGQTLDQPQQDAAFGGVFSGDQLFMVTTVQPARRKPARER